MSYCREEGKDRIMFVTKEDYNKPSTAVINDNDEEEEPGLILANGDINWQCPCLGGMASGPCGVEFREAFSCFHFSEADPKGSDCYEPFRVMQDCMSNYPDLYDSSDDKDKSTPTDISETPSSGDASEQVTPTSDSSNNNSKSDSTTSEAVTKS